MTPDTMHSRCTSATSVATSRRSGWDTQFGPCGTSATYWPSKHLEKCPSRLQPDAENHCRTRPASSPRADPEASDRLELPLEITEHRETEGNCDENRHAGDRHPATLRALDDSCARRQRGNEHHRANGDRVDEHSDDRARDRAPQQ